MGTAEYLPVSRLRYNANLTISEGNRGSYPAVDIPRRMKRRLSNKYWHRIFYVVVINYLHHRNRRLRRG